ncbi:hypothetical protein K438DRAFT_1773965 [Mycena galopus ATCC 62051]|nr:hypothetical protein K438DRAFT_1773965 [Mycena galopus ATCC 62051]
MHCKLCNIKVPMQDMKRTTPVGGGGLKYTADAGVGTAATSCSALTVVRLRAAAPAFGVAAAATRGAITVVVLREGVPQLVVHGVKVRLGAIRIRGAAVLLERVEHRARNTEPRGSKCAECDRRSRQQSRCPVADCTERKLHQNVVEHRAREPKPRAEIQQKINCHEGRGDASPAESILDTEPRGAKTSKERAWGPPPQQSQGCPEGPFE